MNSHDIDMKECVAYGPIPLTQAQHKTMSFPQTEGTYEII